MGDYDYTVYVDGGCLVSSGEMYGSYYISTKKGVTKGKTFKFESPGTNNQAEILSIINALNDIGTAIKEAGKEFDKYRVIIYTDSMLIKQQALGKWKIKNAKLAELHETLAICVAAFKEVRFEWVSREILVEVLGH